MPNIEEQLSNNCQRAFGKKIMYSTEAVEALRAKKSKEWEVVILYYMARYKLTIDLVRAKYILYNDIQTLKHDDIITEVGKHFEIMQKNLIQLYKTTNYIRYSEDYVLNDERYKIIQKAYSNIEQFNPATAPY